VLSGPDFGGPLPRQVRVGSGDVLARTIRQVAAALSAMASARHAADAGRALPRAMDALELAVTDAPLHRNLGDLMRMTD
jgi:hypothetical protein